jgi:hypothetical protein
VTDNGHKSNNKHKRRPTPFENFVLYVAKRQSIESSKQGRESEKPFKVPFFKKFSVPSVISVAKDFDITTHQQRRPA